MFKYMKIIFLCVPMLIVGQNFICETDKAAHEYITKWASSEKATRLIQEKNIAPANPDITSFLEKFVIDPGIVKSLESRPHYDFCGAIIPESIPDYAKKNPSDFIEDDKKYLEWKKNF